LVSVLLAVVFVMKYRKCRRCRRCRRCGRCRRLMGLIKIDKVNEVDRVDGTFCDSTAKVSCKRVVRVINADLCCSINCKSFEGLSILKILQRFPNKNL
jgi:hypothetical protein